LRSQSKQSTSQLKAARQECLSQAPIKSTHAKFLCC